MPAIARSAIPTNANQTIGVLEKISIDKLWVNPDCGLKTRGKIETIASLKNLVTATKHLRNKIK